MKTNTPWCGLVAALLLAGCGNSSDAKHPETTAPTTTATSTAPMGTSTTPPAGTTSAMGASTMGSTPSGAGTAMPTQSDASKAKLSDAEIGAIMDAANGGEVDEATVAQKSAQNAGVKSFAAMMIAHHGEARDKQAKLFSKLSITPSENAKSRDVKATGQKNLETIKPLKGAQLDRAYIDAQVKEHQTVLGLLDEQILPAVQNAEYKALLQDVRGKVEAHLKAAQDLQGKLGKGG